MFSVSPSRVWLRVPPPPLCPVPFAYVARGRFLPIPLCPPLACRLGVPVLLGVSLSRIAWGRPLLPPLLLRLSFGYSPWPLRVFACGRSSPCPLCPPLACRLRVCPFFRPVCRYRRPALSSLSLAVALSVLCIYRATVMLQMQLCLSNHVLFFVVSVVCANHPVRPGCLPGVAT